MGSAGTRAEMDPAELGLQPLIITPEIAARARAELAGSQAPPFDLAAPPRDPPASSSTTALQDINTLQVRAVCRKVHGRGDPCMIRGPFVLAGHVPRF